MSRYNSKSSNPFEDDSNPYTYPSENRGPFEDKRQQLSRMVDESEDRQLESTQRAIASLYESEAMGNATAEELLRQREVINNMEKKTDEINTNLTTSQRHLNNIKSVFGGIKNWWGGKKDQSSNSNGDQARTSSLDTIVQANSSSSNRLGDTTDSRENEWWNEPSDKDLDSRFMAGRVADYQASRPAGQLQYVQPITRSAREDELDRNLGMMSDGLGRLKNLARGLGDEIEQQNEALDRLNPKVNRANELLENQNKQMHKVLKR